MKCEVERYKEGTNLTIKNSINQIMTYFTVYQFPPIAFVRFMPIKIILKQLNKINKY